MFKKQLLLAAFLMCSLIASADKGNPFYYDVISNDTKSIDFLFGLYPNTYSYVEGKDVDPYTSIKGAIINNAKGDLQWSDYKISILLKNGNLIRSYSTVAKDGDYACTYNIDGGKTHYQQFCFHTKFTADDIDKAWLTMTDDKIFTLLYDKNDK